VTVSDETRDAAHRTRLANERTYLAWWRTGVTALAVGLGSGKLIPALSSGSTWPYTAIGVGFAAMGVACSVYAFSRQRVVDAAITRGETAPPDPRMAALLSGGGALLGLLLIVVLLAQS
jgi:inner membrane protein YidH